MQFAGGSLPPRGKLSGLRQCRKFTDNIRMNASAEQRKNLPMANKKFAGGKIYICRLSGKKFAVGKCAAGHRQNACLINGKIKFCNRQIFIF